MLVNFSELLEAKHFNKPITVRCIISGKTLQPYAIPKRIKIHCIGEKDKYCKGAEKCPFGEKGIITITAEDENLLKYIDVNETKFPSLLKQTFKIRCNFSVKILEVQNIERIFMSAPTGKERTKNPSSQVSYFLGYGIDINTTYELSGYSTTDPNTQEATCIFTEAKKLKSDIDSFNLRNRYDELEEFCIRKPTVEKVFEFLDDLYEYYSTNITKIYNRFDLHLAVDMVFKSVISFYFDNELIHKGWIDAIIIGDTRCGKGYVAEKLVKYFNVGEVVSGDNTSFAGLVGGLQQFSGHWIISWGKIPLNDKGLVIIDEAGEIKPEEWGRLTRIRSEGIAEIAKIQKQITNARTRLLSLVNPPLKTISSYSYGIQSLPEVVKSPEDIARFDYALVVSHDEVSAEEINQSRNEVEEMFSPELEQNLNLWVWSRKQNQVEFSNKAISLVYQKAKELAKMYSFSIPLVQKENIRVKLAKMSVCFAGRIFSNKEKGKILFVDVVHVECAFRFFNILYQKEESGYYTLSVLRRSIDEGTNENDIKKMERYFESFSTSKNMLCQTLLNLSRINLNDLIESLNYPREISTEIISKLLGYNLIRKQGTAYVKNPAFTKWLRKIAMHDAEKRIRSLK